MSAKYICDDFKNFNLQNLFGWPTNLFIYKFVQVDCFDAINIYRHIIMATGPNYNFIHNTIITKDNFMTKIYRNLHSWPASKHTENALGMNDMLWPKPN